MSGFLGKDRLIFDPTDPNQGDQTASYIRGADGTVITHTTVGGKEALDVNIAGPISIAVDLNGVYDVSTNPNPDNVGIIAHTRAAAPDNTNETFRSTGGTANADAIVAANVKGLDTNSFLMGYNGATWDRLLATAGILSVNFTNTTIGVTQGTSPWVVGGNVADDGVDAGNPVKVGSRAISGALPAISTTGDRADLLSDMYRRVWINDSPNIGVASVTKAVDTTVGGVSIPTAALAGRRRIMIQNLGNKDIYIGPTGVTAASGLRVANGATLALEIGQNVALFAIAQSGSQDVRLFELA